MANQLFGHVIRHTFLGIFVTRKDNLYQTHGGFATEQVEV
jgi:hypothetical protein